MFDLVVRMWPEYRSSANEIGNLLVPTAGGSSAHLGLANIHQGNGASFIYRENNSRYIGVQFSIEGRDLARAVGDAKKPSATRWNCPRAMRSTGVASPAST